MPSKVSEHDINLRSVEDKEKYISEKCLNMRLRGKILLWLAVSVAYEVRGLFVPRLISSLKMIASATSFMDLRRWRLCRCNVR
jgi:hypothetical protein